MKVFISQPMKGRTSWIIEKERAELKENFKKMFPDDNVEFIDSYRKENKNLPPVKALAKSIELLADANVVFAHNEYWGNRRTKAEVTCAIDYDIPVIFYNETNASVTESVATNG